MSMFTADAHGSRPYDHEQVYRHVEPAVNTPPVSVLHVSIPALQFGQAMTRLSRTKDNRTGLPRGFTFAKLSSYARMFERSVTTIKSWINQLVAAGYFKKRQEPRTQHLHLYPQKPEAFFIDALTPSPETDPSLFCLDVVSVSFPVPVSVPVSDKRITTDTIDTKIQQHTRTKARITISKPDPVTAPLDVVIAEINNEELDTVQSLEAEGLKPVKALELVKKHGSPLCRRHLEAYKASKSARGIGWMLSRIENNWSDHTRQTPPERPQSTYSDSRQAPRVFVPAEPVPVMETGTGRDAARAFMDKRRGGVSFGGWKGR